MMLQRLHIWAICLLLSSLATAQQRYATLAEALSSARRLRGSNGPESVNWYANGNAYSFMQGRNIKAFHCLEQKESTILEAGSVKLPNGNTLDFDSFQWSQDSRYILFKTNTRPIWRYSGTSDYYRYSVADKSIELVAKDANTAQLSPDGSKVGYEHQGNIYVYDFASKKATQLTHDAQAQVYNGRFGWVYEEEFGLVQAWAWSPDSQYIAYWQSDERQVPIYQITDYAAKQPEWQKIPYPKVGDTNPTVRIGVVDIGSGTNRWQQLDLGDGYVPRLYWTSEAAKLAIVQLNRKQNHLKLSLHDVKTGEGTVVMEEKTDSWLDVTEFFADFFFFPNNVKEFFWISDRDGFAHIYRYDYTGKLLNQLTKGAWEVESILGVDATQKLIYYTSTEVSPLERHLYAVSFDGKRKTRLSLAAGRHSFNMSPNCQYYIDRYSNVSTPTRVELWSVKGKKIKDLETNEATAEFLKKYAYAPRELTHFTTSDGQKLDIYIVKPLDFSPDRKYPTILNIYGGPGSQSVYNAFGADGWEQYLAQQGYVIVSINNRGSQGYGRNFKKQVYGKLGEVESKDFAELARYIAKQSWGDASRIGIRGHSYGGYMSSLSILKYPEVFKVALVGAPVTDWRLYDSIYTERYMGLLSENNAQYEATAPIKYAKNLQGKMLIVHSAMDDNVHFQNTMQLVKALIDAGKDADLRVYPPGNHGVAYDFTSYVLLYTQYTDYLEKHLK